MLGDFILVELKVESDNLETVGILTDKSQVLSGHGLMTAIRNLLAQDWLVIVQFSEPPVEVQRDLLFL
ncbi:hypothetical protein V6N13_137410 [Hibiscus sabdariffa]|uniref:Uncharacterized protein n=1 Tax=Hibiscus sabdariffa TaxID=183260 RepID=A0ABR2DNN2_9ROSI